jgi:hypothetical protein
MATDLGEFLEYDPNNNSQIWRKYVRVRLLLDVRTTGMREVYKGNNFLLS